ncbi:YdhK family protein [Pseudalkalibacillus hwajinpoensis]|uniref:YdhK family protein n=1 Tax=Guptibacillus hwajinpoensis TaxID=208199 RepID=UPI00325C13D3
MKNKMMMLGIPFLTFAFILVGCGNDSENSKQENSEEQSNMELSSKDDMDHMDHSGSGKVPENLEEAMNPTYEIGSQAIIESEHMSGMEGAEATIKGAYKTTAYVVSYTPTNGGERVEDHKWVIHEEIEKTSNEQFESGSEVTLNASHMKGMEGAKATIDSANETTVYMIDYTPTTGGEKVSNHKWVTEDELFTK